MSRTRSKEAQETDSAKTLSSTSIYPFATIFVSPYRSSTPTVHQSKSHSLVLNVEHFPALPCPPSLSLPSSMDSLHPLSSPLNAVRYSDAFSPGGE
jgi:hypothetical protein